MSDTPKTVNLMTVTAFKAFEKHHAVGDVLTSVDSEVALELTGAGRTRLATETEVADSKKAAKAGKAEA